MSMPASQKRERTEDKVTRDPVGRYDQSTVLDRIFNEDLAVRCIAQPCDKLRLGHACIHLRVPADIPEPPPRKDPDFLRQAEFLCNDPAFFDQFQFLGNCPPLVDSDRGEKEFFPLHCFKQGEAFEMIDAGSFLQCLKGSICR